MVMMLCDVRVYASIPNTFAKTVFFYSRGPRSLQLQKKDRTRNGLDKTRQNQEMSNWAESSTGPSHLRHRGCPKKSSRLLGIEVDTRVGYDTLRINRLAGSTAVGILVEYDITLVFDELGRMAISSNLSCR